MVVDKNQLTGNALEQFVLLAKSVKGTASTVLINQVLDAPGVYVFGELLDMPNISEVCYIIKMSKLLLTALNKTVSKYTAEELLEYSEFIRLWNI